MYDYVINLITKDFKKNEKMVTQRRVDEVYIGLLYILYLSTKKNYKAKIKELLTENNLEKFYEYLHKEHKFKCFYFSQVDIKKLLKVLKGQNYQDLLLEFLKAKEDPEYIRLEVLKKAGEEVLYINTIESLANYNYRDKKATYLTETINSLYSSEYTTYKLIDEMLKLKREYYRKLKEINLDNYDTIIINDTEAFYKYSANKEDFIKDLEQKFYYENFFKGRIILKTSYNKISHFKYHYLVKYHLAKVILHKDVKNPTVYMEFVPNNKSNITLILLDELLANDNNKLKKIIESNRQKKGVLNKITPDDIVKNNYRISFKMYETENIAKVKFINDIVDENSKLTKKLEGLNKTIEVEVNKLLERTGG